MNVRRAAARWLLGQAVRYPRRGRPDGDLHRHRHHHSPHAEGMGRGGRISRDDRQCAVPGEGRRPARRLDLSAQAGCGPRRAEMILAASAGGTTAAGERDARRRFVCVCGEQDRQPGKRARTKTMATWRNRVARLIRPAFVAYAFSNASAKRDRNSRKAASSFGEYASSTPASIGSTRTLAACSASRPASVMCSSKTFACRR
jgi:hypothetical protein